MRTQSICTHRIGHFSNAKMESLWLTLRFLRKRHHARYLQRNAYPAMHTKSMIPIFWINLDRRLDRRTRMTNLLKDLPSTRVTAIEGSSLTNTEVDSLFSSERKYQLSKNEAGCILSHREIWRTMLAKDIDVACILEDDVELSPDFPFFMRSTDWLPEAFDVIKVETMMAPVFLSRQRRPALSRELRRLRSPHFGTAGYIVSAQGAAKLLQLTKQPDRALDDLMFQITLEANSEITVLQMLPALCAQDFVISDTPSSSDISNDRQSLRKRDKPKGFKKLRRELSRPYHQLNHLLRKIMQKYTTIPYR